MSKECTHCSGTGTCQACNGAGEGPAIDENGKTIWADCKYCKGNGKCGICNGSGKSGIPEK